MHEDFSNIERYGIIGNLHTSALVNDEGSIDMFCAPYFDSPSIFCRTLDVNGGYFKVKPDFTDTTFTVKQRYLPGTNTMATRWLTSQCAVELLDCFSIPQHVISQTKITEYDDFLILRHVEVTRGSAYINIECIPAFNYAQQPHSAHINDKNATFSTSPISVDVEDVPSHIQFEYISNPKATNEFHLFIIVYSPTSSRCIKWDYLPIGNTCGVQASVLLHEDEVLWVGLSSNPTNYTHSECAALYKSTNDYWRKWISKLTYNGKWQEHMERSALVLKLCSFYPSGAIVASPTFALPEEMGGSRNWDYRYIWVRDSSFTIYALIRLGLLEEAMQCLHFVQHICKYRKSDGGLYIMYSIHGCPYIPETELLHLSGFCHSKPVRIGNDAYNHTQMDIYGELMDAIYLFNKFGTPVSYEMWLECIDLVNYVIKHYKTKDMSIWEVRGDVQEFLYSKIMCWVAIDRALRLKEKRDLPCPDMANWIKHKDLIYMEIMDSGYNGKHFKQSYTSDTLDASTMIMSLVFFAPATDPRVMETLKEILKPVEKGGLMRNRLVLRYDTSKSDDGITGDEGAFLMTTFWTIETAIRIAEFQPELVDRLVGWSEEVMQYSSPLGLFSEEISKDGLLLGNYPQAFSHLAFISCAYRLDQLLKNKPKFKLVDFDLGF